MGERREESRGRGIGVGEMMPWDEMILYKAFPDDPNMTSFSATTAFMASLA